MLLLYGNDVDSDHLFINKEEYLCEIIPFLIFVTKKEVEAGTYSKSWSAQSSDNIYEYGMWIPIENCDPNIHYENPIFSFNGCV